MLQKIMYSSFLPFAKLVCGALFVSAIFGACSNVQDCGLVYRVFNEPNCKKLRLAGSRTFFGISGSCVPANARKINVNCPPASGSSGQCTSGSSGLPVFSLLVPNNNSGSFKDDTGIIYSTCSDILNGYQISAIINVSGVYASKSGNASDLVSCTDAGGCTLGSTFCYAGWDKNSLSATGSASLVAGGQYLACTYIDTSSLALTSIAVGTWAAAPTQITIAGDISFNSGWVDAF